MHCALIISLLLVLWWTFILIGPRESWRRNNTLKINRNISSQCASETRTFLACLDVWLFWFLCHSKLCLIALYYVVPWYYLPVDMTERLNIKLPRVQSWFLRICTGFYSLPLSLSLSLLLSLSLCHVHELGSAEQDSLTSFLAAAITTAHLPEQPLGRERL